MTSALALLLADARLPVGGHTQSGGLEPGLAAGLRVHDVPGYCRLRLRTVTRTEAATAVVAAHLACTGRPLDAVADAWAARTPSDALRAASRELGRALLRLAREVWPEAVSGVVRTDPPRPVVLGAIAGHHGLGGRDLARVVAHDDVQTVLAALLKLSPLDPSRTAGWAADLLPDVERLAHGVDHLTTPEEIPASSAPELEQWAQTHATTTRRLFRA